MDTPALTLAASGLSSVSGGASQEVRMEFEKIVSRDLSRFRRVAMRWLRNPEDAEDAVQDAMLSAYKHIGAFGGRARLSTWITAIVINSVRMQLRRRPRCQIVSLDHVPEDGQWAIPELLADPGPTPEQVAERSELRELVARLSCCLPDSQLAALRLRQRDGLSIKEAAETLGVPEGTLKAQLARGRAKLVQRFHKAARKPRNGAVAPAPAAKCHKECPSNYRPDLQQCVASVPIAAFKATQGGYEGCVGA